MHISIPESEELVEPKNGKPTKFVSYKVHINGTYHCSARFSILSKLNDRLKKQYGQGCLEQFPEKKIFYMKPEQANFRRYQLQVWLQKIGAQPLIVQGETFQNFLLNAQKEVSKGPEEDVQLEIYLVNGKKVTIDIMSTDQTNDVLETTINMIGVNETNTYYFALYLIEDQTGKVTVRRLQDFESPYISLKRAAAENRIQLRTAFWDQSVAELLYDDSIALNLLYIETIADIKKGWISVEDDVADDLANFRAQKDRQKFLGVAKDLKGFGCKSFGEAVVSYPQPKSKATIFLGNNELTLQLANDGKEYNFQVQRMRCWRTYSVNEGGVEMEFEYYFDPAKGQKEGEMKWVKMLSPQTIHLAMCLQFMVEEMLRLRKSKPIKKPSDRKGEFKPRRQAEGAKVDLDFITGDDSGDRPASQTSIGSFLGFGSGPRVSVTLSGLRAKVNIDELDQDNTLADYKELLAIDEGGGDAPTADGGADADDSEDDDDGKRAFASMAGL
jgi:sorting nexin-17